jgi:hypothetical protein
MFDKKSAGRNAPSNKIGYYTCCSKTKYPPSDCFHRQKIVYTYLLDLKSTKL